MILAHVLAVLKAGRSPMVLTEHRDHAEYLADWLERFARNIVLLWGGIGLRRRRETAERLDAIPDGEERVLVAVERYVDEGFDDTRLDTLFLAMPVSWKGTLAQYAGRLHRLHPVERKMIVHDYFDREAPLPQRMSEKRIRGYRSLGCAVEDGCGLGLLFLPVRARRARKRPQLAQPTIAAVSSPIGRFASPVAWVARGTAGGRVRRSGTKRAMP